SYKLEHTHTRTSFVVRSDSRAACINHEPGPSLFINAVRTADPTDAGQIDGWPSYGLVARSDAVVYSENSPQRCRTECVCSLSSEPLHRKVLEWSSLGIREL